MKKILFVAIATSLALTPAGIQAQRADIVVSSGRSVDNFVADVSHDLQRVLNTTARAEGTGLAQILFECGPDGKPTNIKLYSRAGDPSVHWRARKAVSKIRSLHPLPQGVTHDQLYLANVIIARDLGQYDRLSAQLRKREAQRIAAAKGDRKIFAFTLGTSPTA